jgi:hypothetical protein
MFPLPPMPPLHVTFCEVAMPWYASPEWWTAIATIALAIITFFLARYTYRLFAATQEAHRDSVNALKVAEENAKATQQSVDISKTQMERSLRPYLIVDEVKVLNNVDHYLPLDLEITITNVGQTPAGDVFMECYAGIEISPPNDQPETYEEDEGIKQLKGVVGNGQKRELRIGFPGALIETNKHALISGAKQLRINGKITYMDFVSNQPRKTEFRYVWNSQRAYFTPIDAIGNAMT